ncbi:MAG: hypothetical protein HY664_07760 [Chloroflexi bacterium]|nr:hypothetical protein [Chloroflexota bacterium]
MDIGTVLLMAGFAYGLGVFWYDLLPGQLAMKPWRVAAYPFAAMVIAEAAITEFNRGNIWAFGGIHVIPAIVAAAIGVIVDWAINYARRPQVVENLERPLPATTRA